MNNCIAAGCGSQTKLNGTLCRTHADRRSKHGHPTVSPVTRAEVRAFTPLVRAELTRLELWASLDQVMDEKVAGQTVIIEEMKKRGVGDVDAYFAAGDFIDAVNDNRRQVMLDLMSLGWLLQLDDDRFPNIDSRDIAAAKAVRWSLKTGRKKYFRPKYGDFGVSKRRLKASAVRRLGAMVISDFVSYGYALAKKYLERERQTKELKHSIMDAILDGDNK